MKFDVKFTKNGKNYQMKNVPQGPEGTYSKVLGTEVRFNPRKGSNGWRVKYPEVKVNGRWVAMHKYILQINGVEVPKGFNRHHLDMDPFNNTIKNIAVVDKNDHRRLHNKYDVENGKATAFKNVYELPSGGFKFINLDDDDETMWKNDTLFGRTLSQLLRKMESRNMKAEKI